MLLYNPVDGDVSSRSIRYRPKTCFIMTKLGKPVPAEIHRIRTALKSTLSRRGISTIDASAAVTGRDFMIKTWEMIASVPLGIAIITEDLPVPTLENIFYEVGLFHSMGKETLVVRTDNSIVPSDFVRTEYVEFGRKFRSEIDKFIDNLFDVAAHYQIVADQLENNPLLELDYLRRSYLISGASGTKARIRELLEQQGVDAYTKAVCGQVIKY